MPCGTACRGKVCRVGYYAVSDIMPCVIPHLTTMVRVCHIVTQAEGFRFPIAPETCTARLVRRNTAIGQVGPEP
jgi:hypothetical protein